MPSNKPSTIADRFISALLSITATVGSQYTSRSNIPNAPRKPASNPRSAASVAAQPILWLDQRNNAEAETVDVLYTAEIIHRRGPWTSFEAVEYAILERVDRFNDRRLPEAIGNVPPAEAEERYFTCWTLDRWRRNSNQTPAGNPGRFNAASTSKNERRHGSPQIGRGVAGRTG